VRLGLDFGVGVPLLGRRVGHGVGRGHLRQGVGWAWALSPGRWVRRGVGRGHLRQGVGSGVGLGMGTFARALGQAWGWAWAPSPGRGVGRGVGRGHSRQGVGSGVGLGVGTFARALGQAWGWAWAPSPGRGVGRGVGRGHSRQGVGSVLNVSTIEHTLNQPMPATSLTFEIVCASQVISGACSTSFGGQRVSCPLVPANGVFSDSCRDAPFFLHRNSSVLASSFVSTAT